MILVDTFGELDNGDKFDAYRERQLEIFIKVPEFTETIEIYGQSVVMTYNAVCFNDDKYFRFFHNSHKLV